MTSPPIDPSDARYTEGTYARENPDWHLPDAPLKAADLYPAFRAIHQQSPDSPSLSIADIGAGAAGVLAEIVAWHGKEYPNLQIRPTGFEIAADAVALAGKHFPNIAMQNKFLDKSDGPFDVTMFVDVLEHVENPW
jgi:2-polyprenyl-3-methyl-5-hydroxy-6-metoxy-1,4-benzoquinol methylase